MVVRRSYDDSFFARPALRVVLVAPEIPPNTGAVARLCAATSSPLHLVRPLGFSLEDKHLKRAGLDYWDKVDVTVHDSLDEVIGPVVPEERSFLLSTRSARPYWTIPAAPGSALVFGRESVGLTDEELDRAGERVYSIPQVTDTVRSINLSNAVGIVLYDCYRRLAGRG